MANDGTRSDRAGRAWIGRARRPGLGRACDGGQPYISVLWRLGVQLVLHTEALVRDVRGRVLGAYSNRGSFVNGGTCLNHIFHGPTSVSHLYTRVRVRVTLFTNL